MTPSQDASSLVQEALAGGGRVRLATILTALLPVDELRDLTRRFGLSPRGYRVERAPPIVLATTLCDGTAVDVLDAVCARLLEHGRTASAEPAPTLDVGAARSSVLRLKDEELARLRSEAAKAKENLARARQREAERERDLGVARAEIARLRAEVRGPASRSRLRRPPTRTRPMPDSGFASSRGSSRC